jgi:class 3 adenylate cyclase/isopentenyldiphosphate isomerase
MQTTDPSQPASIVVLFVDIRGFTDWAERVDVFLFLDRFGHDFHAMIEREFKDFTVKFLGDGAMIVKESALTATTGNLRSTLQRLLRKIASVERKFQRLCEAYATRHGSRVALRLGWAIAKGSAKRVDDDFVGPDINKASRLCAIARPYGILVDRDDFPQLPASDATFRFVPQVRKLVGIRDDVSVWATDAIASQFLARETLRETPEVHVAGLCFRKERGILKALLSRRSPNRRLFPNLYEGCGGQLARNESFVDGVKRHYKLELGIDIAVQEDRHTFYLIISPGEGLIPGIKFMCRYKSGEPTSVNHTEFKWVSREELAAIPDDEFIPETKNVFLKFMAAA